MAPKFSGIFWKMKNRRRRVGSKYSFSKYGLRKILLPSRLLSHPHRQGIVLSLLTDFLGDGGQWKFTYLLLGLLDALTPNFPVSNTTTAKR